MDFKGIIELRIVVKIENINISSSVLIHVFPPGTTREAVITYLERFFDKQEYYLIHEDVHMIRLVDEDDQEYILISR